MTRVGGLRRRRSIRRFTRPGSGIIRKPAPSPLRTGRDHRRGHSRQIRAGRRFAQPMLSVHDSGFEPSDRSVAGRGSHRRSAQSFRDRHARGTTNALREAATPPGTQLDRASDRSGEDAQRTAAAVASDGDVGSGNGDGPPPRHDAGRRAPRSTSAMPAGPRVAPLLACRSDPVCERCGIYRAVRADREDRCSLSGEFSDAVCRHGLAPWHLRAGRSLDDLSAARG